MVVFPAAARPPRLPKGRARASIHTTEVCSHFRGHSESKYSRGYSAARPCPLFPRGLCQKGDLCNYIHPAFPNQAQLSPETILPVTATLSPQQCIPSTQERVAFIAPFVPRHAASVPMPLQQKAPSHTYSLPPFSTSAVNTSLDIPTTPVSTCASTSSSISASPASSLVASPPQSFFHRISDNDIQDEETDAVIGGGIRFGAIGSGIFSFTKEPMTMVHEIYTYDDDDDDQVVYMGK